MSLPPSPKKDLAVRESILNVLNTKDKSGKGVVKMSEFDGVIQAFGLSWESTAVKNVLEHCKVDRGENLNFSALKDELLVEKQRLNTIPKHKVRRPIVVATPQASGIIKEKQTQMREKQQRAVQQQTAQVQTIYKMLSNHDINKNTAVNLLSQHNIFPTKDLLKVAGEMELHEVPFAEFNRALTSSDPYPRASAILAAQSTSVLAGTPKRPPCDRFAPEESMPGRRMFETPPSQHFVPPEEFAITEYIKPARKFTLSENPRAKTSTVGAVFNETGDSWLGNPEDVDWSTSPSGRRHAIYDGQIVDVARAQLNHGDCISWDQRQTELEAWNEALTRPEGRKVDEQALWTNHLSDVISWQNKGDISPEAAIRSEFALSGGLSVANGQRNATSQKNILAWEERGPQRRPAGKKASSFGPDGNPLIKASSAVLNIGELDHQGAASLSPYLVHRVETEGHNYAGSPSLRQTRPTLRKQASFSDSTSTAPPFGVDSDSPSSKSAVSYFERGRTPSGARYGPTSPVAGGAGKVDLYNGAAGPAGVPVRRTK